MSRKAKKRPSRKPRLRWPGLRWNGLRWTAVLLCLVVLLSVAAVLPLRWIDPPTSAFMLRDASGMQPVLYDWREWEELGIAPALAVVSSEDQRFADHFGLDFKSIEAAIEGYERGESLRGASTITQQVAKNLYLWPGRSLVRKGLEAWLTLFIELCLPKKRILEIYLNIVELGPGIYGFPAASRYYFDRQSARLDNSQAALFAAVLPNPHRYQVARPSPYVRQRQQWILEQMGRLQRQQWIRHLK
jgi:monofunctional biosynthetic peptidoglycan transglycosylase